MALAAGPKTKNLKPLPYRRAPVPWIEACVGKLYPWQRDVLRDLTAPDRPRVAYIQIPRKQGKTRLAATLALVEMCLKKQRQIYCIADSERNLDSALMQEIRDMIYGSDQLRESLHIYKDKVECPETGSFIKTRASNFAASQSINPHLVLFDEVHMQRDDKIWAGMQMAGAARTDALLLGITTPGYDLTSMAHGLYQQVKAANTSMYGRIWESDPAADIDVRENWQVANPCYTMPGFAASMESDRELLAEHQFRRFRLGQWTATESAWLRYGVWDDLANPQGLPPAGTRVWLAFDGSYSGDSTALIGCTHEGYVFVVGCWENPNPSTRGWRVPRDDVMATVAGAFEHWDVQELICDPPYWQSEIAQWAARWNVRGRPDRVIEFPTWSRQLMAPATTTFHAAVMDGALTHDGDPRLARHIANCVVNTTPQGDVITKASADSPAKIDLAVAAVLAFSRASVSVSKPKAPAFVHF
jgi:phage terminase large subunit-like protein